MKSCKLGLGGAWSVPVIQTVVLPVHAQTSVPTTTESVCEAAPNCYAIDDVYFSWPGGVGPARVEFFLDDNCSIPVGGTNRYVVARSQEEAVELAGPDAFVQLEPGITPALSGGCNFYSLIP